MLSPQSNGLEHHSLNIERTRTHSYFVNQSQTPYFCLQMNRDRTYNNTCRATRLADLLVELTQMSASRTSNGIGHICLLEIELQHLIFGF